VIKWKAFGVADFVETIFNLKLVMRKHRDEKVPNFEKLFVALTTGENVSLETYCAFAVKDKNNYRNLIGGMENRY
jgi:23S rRNA C2498 (ribose-2'-O)-methylase RlmM